MGPHHRESGAAKGRRAWWCCGVVLQEVGTIYFCLLSAAQARVGLSPVFVVLSVVAVHRQTPKGNSNSCCTAAAPVYHHCTTAVPLVVLLGIFNFPV